MENEEQIDKKFPHRDPYFLFEHVLFDMSITSASFLPFSMVNLQRECKK